MIDIKNIREQQSLIQDRLAKRDKSINLDNIISADLSLRELTKKLNDLQSDQNRQSKEIGILKSEGKADDSVFAKLKELSNTIKDLEVEHRTKSKNLKSMLLDLPNIPHSSVPVGTSEKDNALIKDCDSKKEISFSPKSHVDIAQDLDLIDFEAGAKISGAGFPLYKGNGALLERALLNFMIDFHLKNYNYTEFFTPFLVMGSVLIIPHFQIALGGIDIKIASIFPSVSKPNFVPRSYNKLNSAYLPRFISCFLLSSFVHFFLMFLEIIFGTISINDFPVSLTKAKSFSNFFVFSRSKKIPPSPLVSFLWGK